MARSLVFPLAITFVLLTLLLACSTTPMSNRLSSAVVADIAPSGKLRAVINLGNPVLASKDAATGEPRGVSVDLARELALRLNVPLELISVTTAARAVDAIKSRDCDIGFVAIDPARATDMDYTAPYVLIEGAYLVPRQSSIKSNEDVDRDGVRVGVGAGSAYDLYLSRELKRARIVRAPTSAAVVDTMLTQRYEVAAGVRQQLEADARRVADVRVIDGRFMVIKQAMALPKGRAAGARYLVEFVEEMKASGFVASALARNGVEGATVAPAARNGT
jgi:polar amino acid transport system substrate-binding protein